MTETVYRDLRKAILQGELEAGRRLLIMDIAQKLEISQAPVREALARLRQEGLVISNQNKGSFVANITEKDIYDISKVREVLEGYVVKETITSLTPQDYQRLETIVEQMEVATEENNSYRLIELDMEFHGFFYERCNNLAMLDIWQSIKTKIMRFNAATSKNYTNEDLVASHKELIEVVKSKDVQLAESKFITHMQSYRRFKYM
jgi:DNA-binding GntR family transcriptional regulator